MENNDIDCPICYTSIQNNNRCITSCNHIFHTGCLIRSGSSVCPMCRNNLIQEIPPPGLYAVDKYLEQLRRNDILVDELSSDVQQWLKDCAEYKQREEKQKRHL